MNDLKEVFYHGNNDGNYYAKKHLMDNEGSTVCGVRSVLYKKEQGNITKKTIDGWKPVHIAKKLKNRCKSNWYPSIKHTLEDLIGEDVSGCRICFKEKN